MTGKKFGRLSVIRLAGLRKDRVAMWECVCECGATTVTNGKFLRSGESQSCGCLRKERAAIATSRAKTTHGHTKNGKNTRAYRIWTNMRSRCENEKFDSYPYYGGRGIKVCDRWRVFELFLYDMGAPGAGESIDRINPDKDYEPDNCRWATKVEQANNTRRNVRIHYKGITRTMTQWSRIAGIAVGTIHSRMKRGWDGVRAISEPVKGSARAAK